MLCFIEGEAKRNPILFFIYFHPRVFFYFEEDQNVFNVNIVKKFKKNTAFCDHFITVIDMTCNKTEHVESVRLLPRNKMTLRHRMNRVPWQPSIFQ